MRGRSGWLALRHVMLLSAAACASLPPAASGGAESSSSAALPPGERSDRITIGSYAVVHGLAATDRLVFVAGENGIAMFDRLRDQWLPPLTEQDGYVGGAASVMAADPVEDGVWVAARDKLVYYRAITDVLTTMVIPGGVDAILFDRRAPARGAYVHAASGWTLANRLGFVTPVAPAELPPAQDRIVPPDLRSVEARYPSITSFQALLTRDEQMHSWPLTSATTVPQENAVWLGTAGGGVYEVDPVFNRSTHRSFGLIGRWAVAVAVDARGVWVASVGVSPATANGRGGVTFASGDLQHWMWYEGGASAPLERARIYALDVDGDAVWVAMQGGVLRLDAQQPGDARLLRADDGLPADRVSVVRAVRGGAWVGTPEGAALLRDTPRSPQVARVVAHGVAIHAIAAVDDSVWLGTDAGLIFLSPQSPDSAPRRMTTDARLTHGVRALAAADSVLVVVTESELLMLRRATGEVLPGLDGVFVSSVGEVTGVAADDRTIWITGTRGVAVVQRATAATRVLVAGRDIPPEPAGVALQRDAAWIATRNGLVRLARLADGSVR